MSGEKHTQGPWYVGYSTKGCAVYMKPVTDGWLVRDQVAKFPRDEEGMANARLIASAPRLLAALKALNHAVSLYDTEDFDDTVLNAQIESDAVLKFVEEDEE